MSSSSNRAIASNAEINVILNDLQRRFDNEQNVQASLHAEGRLHYSYQGNERIGWLHRTLPLGSKVIRTITGTFAATSVGAVVHYDPDHSAISRNSENGNRLAEATPGVEENGFCLIDRALYTHQQTDLQDIEIATTTDSYERIPSLLEYQQELAREVAKLRALQRQQEAQEQATQASDDTVLNEIRAAIGSAEDRIRRIRQRLETFTTRTTLRSRPLLDPAQNKAKRLNLLEGPVIIEGGPGTGKTTTLIHRVQYLLDTYHLRRDERCKRALSQVDDELLTVSKQGKQPYRFYSPNKTLQYYLKEALLTEGLQVNQDTVTTWSEHRQQLLRAFGLIGTEGRFQLLKEDAALLNLSGVDINALLHEIDERMVLELWSLVGKVATNSKSGEFGWQQDILIQRLQQQINSLERYATVEALIEPLYQLREQGAGILPTYRKAYNEVRDKAVNQLLAAARPNAALFQQLLQLAESVTESGSDQEHQEDQQDDEAFEEDDKSAASLPTSERQLLLVQRMLRTFIRAYALANTLPDSRLRSKDVQIANLMQSQLASLDYSEIASNARFIQLFGRLLSGPEALLLQAWPRLFATFRREVLYGGKYAAAFRESVTPKWNPDKAAKLHPDESDLLLLGLFRFARAFYAQSPQLFATSPNRYLAAYRDAFRPVLAVDEASDYTPLQLNALTLLAHPRYTCITLCGDLMQRLGHVGLVRWEDYEAMFTDTKRASLEISYRQCRTLLNLAAKLYEGQLKQKPTYRVSKRIKMPFRLRPTFCREAEAETRFEWLVKLLVELHQTLGSQHLPNLAILVANKQTADELAQKLADDDQMNEAALLVESCQGQTIGNTNTIRIFPVTEIKGMEFDGIVFWDADKLAEDKHDLDRLMYVAVSRASFYVAVTFERFFPKALSKVKGYFTAKQWAEQMLEDVLDVGEEKEEIDEKSL